MENIEVKTFQMCSIPSVLFLMAPVDEFNPADALASPLATSLLAKAKDYKVSDLQRNNNPICELPSCRTAPVLSKEDPTERYIEMIINGHPLPPVIACLTRCGGNRIVNNDHSDQVTVLPDSFGIELVDGRARLECTKQLNERGIPIPASCRNIGVMLYCGLSWVERAKLSLRLRPHRSMRVAAEHLEAAEMACVFGEHVTAEMALNQESPLRGTITPFGPISASCLADTIAGFCLSGGRMGKMLSDDDVGGAVEMISLYIESISGATDVDWCEPDFDPETALARCLSAMREIDSKISANLRTHRDIFAKCGRAIIYGNGRVAEIISGAK